MINGDHAVTAALSTTAPDVPPEEVRALARRLYDVDGSVQALAGERDQNCLVETADGRRYVLKISNPAEPASEVTISSHRRHDFRKFEEVAGKHREIVEWYNVSGGYDYLLQIVVPSVGLFQELMERLLQSDIGIEKFTSRIVLRQSSGKRIYPLSLIAAPRGRMGSAPVTHGRASSDNPG